MAIKVSGNTFIDDNRNIVNAGVVTSTHLDTDTLFAETNFNVGSSITMYGASGIISASQVYLGGQDISQSLGGDPLFVIPTRTGTAVTFVLTSDTLTVGTRTENVDIII